ncbi:TetR/AcrR family transcriptional regulator [Lysinibacillus sp. SGAir0095]|uniref:TetR/AcrR family transcriptional regulator n=1 Tax=Lysinibacillus sp. SGAir0095 TaxID=2070463 RepID=UPI0010CCDCC8|nr:TetR/AcrR family transcriptional regulator [Lysinibacillus sp. SGAir0095]QCR31948.1 TetR/AcrR family transcriptional regulator [Lysinibacillus sp. SGAir0095]
MGEYSNKTAQTKKRIKQALLELLDKESINHISTSQIARMAEINRVTLYRHFEDKWDILESIENDFLTQLIEPHSKMRLRIQNENKLQINHPGDELIQFLNVFRENLSVLKVLMNNHGDSDFTNKMLKFLIKLEQLSHPYLELNISITEKELFSYYTISSLIGMVQFWISHPNYTTETMAQFFFKMRLGAIKELSNK